MRVWKSVKGKWKVILAYLILTFSIAAIGMIVYKVSLPEIVLFLLVGTFVFLLFYDTYKRSIVEDLVYGNSFGKNYQRSPTPPIVTNFDKIPNAAKLVEELAYYDKGIARDYYKARIVAVEAIDRHFDKIPNATKLIERLANDKDRVVRTHVVDVINHHFDKIPNAAKIIERFANDKDEDIRSEVVNVINNHFDKITNATKIIEKATNDKDKDARYEAVYVIECYFDKIPNAAKILEKLAYDEDSRVRNRAIRIIKEKWNYLGGIYKNKFSESVVEEILSEAESGEIRMLKKLISGEIDEEKSEQIYYLVERILSEYKSENKIALCNILFENFHKFPNSEKIVERILNDKDKDVRYEAVKAIDKHFDKIPNAARLIERLSNNKDKDVRFEVAMTINHHFYKIPNAAKILERLANNKDKEV